MEIDVQSRFFRFLSSRAGSTWLDEREAEARRRSIDAIDAARRRLRDLANETRGLSIGNGQKVVGHYIDGSPQYKHYSTLPSINRRLAAIAAAQREIEAIKPGDDAELEIEALLAGVDQVQIVTEEV